MESMRGLGQGRWHCVALRVGSYPVHTGDDARVLMKAVLDPTFLTDVRQHLLEENHAARRPTDPWPAC
jgi:hypothetical protein